MNLEKWLHAKQGQVFHYKMEKIKHALKLLGNPEKAISVIHVAGTNGKGSTIAFMKELFQQHHLTVGTFVSPHMISVHDRICMDGNPITDIDFQRLLQVVYELEKVVAESYEPFRYFEVMVLIMFLYFQEQKPDIALIEVGIGGLLDTTNVVDPVISVITSVGLDHQDLLGNSIADIAEQKAGIIKAHRPVVLGPLSEEVVQICQRVAKQKRSPLYLAGRDYRFGVDWFANSQMELHSLKIGLKGDHQIENASLALQAFLIYMAQQQLPVESVCIRRALQATTWAGRLEHIQTEPSIYLDGAHNIPAIRRLADFIREQEQPATILFSALIRKDFQEMLEVLSQELPDVPIILTSFSYDGSLKSNRDLSEYSYQEDYKQVIKDWQNNGQGTLFITGSLYFISEVRKLFDK